MSLTDEQARVVEIVREVVPPIVLDWLPRHLGPIPGRCLSMSRVGYETLRYFGVRVVPTTVRALAVNAAWQEWAERTGAEGPLDEAAWSVASGWAHPNDHERGYVGHVVLVLAHESLLLDLDAGQFSRPERSMSVPPTLLLPFEPVEKYDGKRFAMLRLSEEGASITYTANPEAPSFKHALDWRKANEVAGRAIREVRERV